ncbi:protoheme IX farnesyltransferase [Mucilaginibacter lappiensis]|uniref:protoheme IX farnesyltransferase n=1 Tax=Mucilaginibacter lappiensis TaxID=354630 RepID=UPI003D1A475C
MNALSARIELKAIASDIAQLIKLRLTFSVTLSCSLTYLIGSKLLIARKEIPGIDWNSWLLLTIGGFLITSAASCLNEVIEVKTDKLMNRTKNRPLPAGRMTTGQGLVIGLIMAVAGMHILNSLGMVIGLLSFSSIILYAFIYTPLKLRTRLAVLVGAIPGALPPLIGYLAAIRQSPVLQNQDLILAFIIFMIQFIWQFPHFWAIAWVADEDYTKAGFHLLPTRKKDSTSATIILGFTVGLFCVGMLPVIFGFLGFYPMIVTNILGLIFIWFAIKLVLNLNSASAKKMMFCSFFYLPLFQLMLLLA